MRGAISAGLAVLSSARSIELCDVKKTLYFEAASDAQCTAWVQVLSGILELSIRRAADVAWCAGTCTAFRNVLKHASLVVEFPKGYSPYVSLERARAMLRSLQQYSPGGPQCHMYLVNHSQLMHCAALKVRTMVWPVPNQRRLNTASPSVVSQGWSSLI